MGGGFSKGGHNQDTCPLAERWPYNQGPYKRDGGGGGEGEGMKLHTSAVNKNHSTPRQAALIGLNLVYSGFCW